MVKSVVSFTLLAMLCGPALADSKTLALGFAVQSGKDTRHYEMKLVDQECGSAGVKSPEVEDEIRACLQGEGKLALEWSTREGARQVRSKSTVHAERGTTFTIGNDGSKLTVSLQ